MPSPTALAAKTQATLPRSALDSSLPCSQTYLCLQLVIVDLSQFSPPNSLCARTSNHLLNNAWKRACADRKRLPQHYWKHAVPKPKHTHQPYLKDKRKSLPETK